MRLIEMRPENLHDARRHGMPVVMASGVLEYHGPHLPIGTDVLFPQALCEQIERRCPVVLAPPLCFGPTGSWAGSPAEGELDLPVEVFAAHATAVLRGLLDLGLAPIYVMQHHQGLEGMQGMALRLAATRLAFDEGRSAGPGWASPTAGAPPLRSLLRRIRVCTPGSFLPDGPSTLPVDHGGPAETQLMAAVAPGTVQMDALPNDPTDGPVWMRDARHADPATGQEWVRRCVDSWVTELTQAQTR